MGELHYLCTMTRIMKLILIVAMSLLLGGCSHSGSEQTVSLAAVEVQGDNAPAVEAVTDGGVALTRDAGAPHGLVAVRVPLTLRLVRSITAGRASATPTLVLLDAAGTPLCFAELDGDCRQALADFLNGPVGAQQQFTFTALVRPDDGPALSRAVAARLTGFSFTTSPERALARPDCA